MDCSVNRASLIRTFETVENQIATRYPIARFPSSAPRPLLESVDKLKSGAAPLKSLARSVAGEGEAARLLRVLCKSRDARVRVLRYAAGPATAPSSVSCPLSSSTISLALRHLFAHRLDREKDSAPSPLPSPAKERARGLRGPRQVYRHSLTGGERRRCGAAERVIIQPRPQVRRLRICDEGLGTQPVPRHRNPRSGFRGRRILRRARAGSQCWAEALRVHE